MNLIDVLIVVGLMAGATWGFIKGVIHQLIGLGLVYLSLVVATALYSSMAPWVSSLVKISPQAGGAIAFLFILIVTLNLLALALRDMRKREYKFLRLVNQLGGMGIGFLIASVWVALGVALLHYSVAGSVHWEDTSAPTLITVPSASFQSTVLKGLANSPLAGAFSSLLPLILSSVSPFAPTREVLSIFVVR